MNEPAESNPVLQAHLAVCRELLAVIEAENRALSDPRVPSLKEFAEARKRLLPRLEQSLVGLQRHRASGRSVAPTDRMRSPSLAPLLRQCQEMTMRILVLDRENEQQLLRRGLMPARDLPSVNRQRPRHVVDVYQRYSAR